MLQQLRHDVKQLEDKEKARFLAGFFKTGKGQYGEGDVFYGLTVPQCRVIATKYKTVSLQEIEDLLRSKIHEERLIALIILVDQFKKGTTEEKKEIYDLYLSHTKHINNWDLVDTSADKIVGGYLLHLRCHAELDSASPTILKRIQDDTRNVLLRLANSQNLWEKRIAIMATYQFIKEQKAYKDTFVIAEFLLRDKHDLIHKAVGWMLREVGKRVSQDVEETFLRKHYKEMPRTMLRYAIEHFLKEKRLRYLRGKL